MARGDQEEVRKWHARWVESVAQGRDHGQHKDAGRWLKVLDRAGRPANLKSRLEGFCNTCSV